MGKTRTAKMLMLDPNNNSTTATINYINTDTNITAATLQTGIYKLADLTNNTYQDTNIIDTQRLSEMVEEES